MYNAYVRMYIYVYIPFIQNFSQEPCLEYIGNHTQFKNNCTSNSAQGKAECNLDCYMYAQLFLNCMKLHLITY